MSVGHRWQDGLDPHTRGYGLGSSPGGTSGDRGVSTVLDVSLATLLVGAAIATLIAVPAPPTDDVGSDPADGVADALGSTTVTVEYTLSPGARRADDRLLEFPEDALFGPGFRRSATGPVGGLLARAAVGDATIDGEAITHSTNDLERKVGRRAVEVAGDDGTSVQVRATWRPFPESSVRGRVVAGPSPPPDAAVHAATMDIASGLPSARTRAIAAADEGYDAVARVLANATVSGLLPPERTKLAIQGDYPRSALTIYRYRHAADLLGTTVARRLSDGAIRAANRRLVAALAGRFRRRLEANYPTPLAAAKRASVGAVTVTVRTWSP